MKRLIICGVAMAVVVLVSFYARHLVRDRSEMICNMTDSVLAAADRPEAAIARLEDLEERWRSIRRALGFFVRADKLEEISCRVVRLRAMYTEGSDDFPAECLELEERLRLLIV
ncbi:MAG: DUF4363 family protein [Ruminococcus sp.]|nr:DUF4363 family protein [Ruminococcus sp.]